MAVLIPLIQPGSFDHGAATGLGDDDHAHYLLVNPADRSLIADLDVGANNIVNVGQVDGRDILADGANLDDHLDEGASKHDSSEIDVEGTYANISGTPTDLETALAAIDVKLGVDAYWDRAGTTIFPINSGDDLDMLDADLLNVDTVDGVANLPLNLYSRENDDVSSIGFEFDTQNLLDTEGSRIFSVKNQGNEYLTLRRGDDLYGNSDVSIAELSNKDGDPFMQISSAGNNLQLILPQSPAGVGNNTTLQIYNTNDWTYGAGYLDGWIDINHDSVVIGSDVGGASFDQMKIGSTNWTFDGTNQVDNVQAKTIFTTDNLISVGGINNIRWYFSTGAVNDRKNIFAISELGEFIGGTRISKLPGSVPFSDWEFLSQAVDGATNKGYTFNTINTFSTAGAKHTVWAMNDISLMSLDKDGNLAVTGTVEGIDITDHNIRHESAGTDEIDGDHLDIDWNPSNYTPDAGISEANSVDDLSAHLNGIDSTMGALDATPTNYTPTDAAIIADHFAAIDAVLPTISNDDLGNHTATQDLDMAGFSLNNFVFERVATAINLQTSGQTIIGVTNTSVPRTITIATADIKNGKPMFIKDESGGAGTNNITIDAQAGETIDGLLSIKITVDFGGAIIYSDGTNLFTL